jgi:hypothetical protein
MQNTVGARRYLWPWRPWAICWPSMSLPPTPRIGARLQCWLPKCKKSRATLRQRHLPACILYLDAEALRGAASLKYIIHSSQRGKNTIGRPRGDCLVQATEWSLGNIRKPQYRMRLPGAVNPFHVCCHYTDRHTCINGWAAGLERKVISRDIHKLRVRGQVI